VDIAGLTKVKKMAKNKIVMSISIDPDMHEELKRYAKTKGMQASPYVCLLINKALKLAIDEDPVIVGKPANEDVIPVVLKVPGNLKGNPESLKKWMDNQTAGLVNKLGNVTA
jgi:hypothetical protein